MKDFNVQQNSLIPTNKNCKKNVNKKILLLLIFSKKVYWFKNEMIIFLFFFNFS